MSQYFKGINIWKNYRRYFLTRFAVFFVDMIAVSCGYLFAYAVRFYWSPFLNLFPITKGLPPIVEYFIAGPLILFMWVIALSWVGAYQRISYPALDELVRVFKGSILGTILAMSAMFLYREDSFSRLVFIIGGGFSALFIYLEREFLKWGYVLWVRRNKRPRKVLILGNGYLSASLQKILERQGDRAVLKLNSSDPSLIEKTISRSRIHEVLAAHPKLDQKGLVRLAGYCEERMVRFRVLPDLLEIRMGEVLIDESLGVPTFQLKPLSLYGTAFFTKRLMDLVLASLFIFIFLIPLLIVCLLVKVTSKGPIFYKQKRMGYRGRSFNFLKFRTMVQNADELLEELKAKSDRGGPVFKMKKDPRITPIGSFLRRYSIDEIPQLINVLKGEMSLVGPRPQVLWETESYNEWAKKRLNVLPGITGLWQVSGRAELTFEEMIDLDIYYIEHWSPGLDIKIMMKTIPAVLLGKGAY